MSKVSTRKTDDLEIAVLRREQLVMGVRGKYLRQYTQSETIRLTRRSSGRGKRR